MLKGQVGRTEKFSTAFDRTEVVGDIRMVSVGLERQPHWNWLESKLR